MFLKKKYYPGILDENQMKLIHVFLKKHTFGFRLDVSCLCWELYTDSPLFCTPTISPEEN